MGKFADRYYKIDPWKIIEEGFNPDYSKVSESIFSLGNEYMGIRGYFEEAYSGATLVGSYVNGIYEKRPLQKSGYRGMIDSTEFMVNSVDWLGCRIECNGQLLDLNKVTFRNFERTLDLKKGLLRRQFIWELEPHTEILITFERCLSMTNTENGGQKIHFSCLKGHADIHLSSQLDFSVNHMMIEDNWWEMLENSASGQMMHLAARTKTTHQVLNVYSYLNFEGNLKLTSYDYCEKKVISHSQGQLEEGETCCLEKCVGIYKDLSISQERLERLTILRFEDILSESENWWHHQWAISDIVIEGDDLNQQGIRYCIFQLHQTLHTANHSAIIGAKGLTGEAYNGNTFWDTEVYCLPFYLFNNPQAAKNILQFRYDSLPQAQARANALDLEGAFYPIATISGDECCDLWQHASLQLQASTGVMYGIWLYWQIIGDKNFVYDQGIKMLIEISRMLATRGDYSHEGQHYGYFGVMGPDEFQMMVNHNTYTNYMAKKTFEMTLNLLEELEKDDPDLYQSVTESNHLKTSECLDWKDKAQKMMILYDDQTHLFEQHDGYFDLPHKAIESIPVEDFPLYSHWSYERIYRNDMLKQPDVLMFMLMYNGDFSQEDLKANFDYYEPRCIHESSLSPSVHSILAQQIGKADKAYDFFGFATRMDLDNYNRNTHEGLHTTSIAGSWLNIVYGFGGLRLTADGMLNLSPQKPPTWNAYQFKLLIHGQVLKVDVDEEWVELTLELKKDPNESQINNEIDIQIESQLGRQLVKCQSSCHEADQVINIRLYGQALEVGHEGIRRKRLAFCES